MTTDTSTRTRSATGSPSGERVQEAASDLMDQAGRTAEAQASRTMTQAGQTLGRVAEVVREAGQELRTDRPEIAGVADTAANQVERAAEYLREHDATDVWNDATGAARRQPALVIGGALIAGFALGRFLRTATESQSSPYAGTSGSRFGSRADARMRSSDSTGSSPYDTSTPSPTSFENRTSELEGTVDDYSTGGSSTRPSSPLSASGSASRAKTSTSSSGRSSGTTRRGGTSSTSSSNSSSAGGS